MKLTELIGGALVLVLFVLSGAEGNDWVSLGTDATESVWYIDRASITRSSKNIVKVWKKTIYSDKSRTTFEPKHSDLKEDKTRLEFNCTTKRNRVVSSTHYDSQGHVISTMTNKNAKWSRITPDSETEVIFKVLCPKKGKK